MENSQIRAQFHCENTAIPITKDSEMGGATVDDNIKFEWHMAYVCRNVSKQIAVLKRMILPFETRKCSYLAFIIPYFNYCSETRHFFDKNTTVKPEKFDDRVLRFVLNA